MRHDDEHYVQPIRSVFIEHDPRYCLLSVFEENGAAARATVRAWMQWVLGACAVHACRVSRVIIGSCGVVGRAIGRFSHAQSEPWWKSERDVLPNRFIFRIPRDRHVEKRKNNGRAIKEPKEA